MLLFGNLLEIIIRLGVEIKRNLRHYPNQPGTLAHTSLPSTGQRRQYDKKSKESQD